MKWPIFCQRGSRTAQRSFKQWQRHSLTAPQYLRIFNVLTHCLTAPYKSRSTGSSVLGRVALARVAARCTTHNFPAEYNRYTSFQTFISSLELTRPFHPHLLPHRTREWTPKRSLFEGKTLSGWELIGLLTARSGGPRIWVVANASPTKKTIGIKWSSSWISFHRHMIA